MFYERDELLVLVFEAPAFLTMINYEESLL